MTKAIIFDLDGLLVNTEIISFNIYRDLLCDYGKTFTIDDYTKSYSGNPSDVNLTNIIKNYQLPLSFDEGDNKINDIESQ